MTTKTKHYRPGYVSGLPAYKLATGLHLVHNHVRPASPLGLNGFRAWITDKTDGLVQCRCRFDGCRNAGVNPHYRVALRKGSVA